MEIFFSVTIRPYTFYIIFCPWCLFFVGLREEEKEKVTNIYNISMSRGDVNISCEASVLHGALSGVFYGGCWGIASSLAKGFEKGLTGRERIKNITRTLPRYKNTFHLYC